MIKLPNFALAVVLLLLPLAAQAAPAAGAPPTPGVTVVPKPQPSNKFTFSEVMAMVLAGKPSADVVGKITSSTNVQFVEIHMLRGFSSAANVFTSDEQKALVKLGATVGHNAFLMKKLRRAGFMLGDVVALSLNADGSAVAFINL